MKLSKRQLRLLVEKTIIQSIKEDKPGKTDFTQQRSDAQVSKSPPQRVKIDMYGSSRFFKMNKKEGVTIPKSLVGKSLTLDVDISKSTAGKIFLGKEEQPEISSYSSKQEDPWQTVYLSGIDSNPGYDILDERSTASGPQRNLQGSTGASGGGDQVRLSFTYDIKRIGGRAIVSIPIKIVNSIGGNKAGAPKDVKLRVDLGSIWGDLDAISRDR